MGTLDWTTHKGKQLVIKHRIPEGSRQQVRKLCRRSQDGYIRGQIDQQNNELEESLRIHSMMLFVNYINRGVAQQIAVGAWTEKAALDLEVRKEVCPFYRRRKGNPSGQCTTGIQDHTKKKTRKQHHGQ
ncbi:hypothetical protein ABVT39_013382 [Epinephelus coioides]